MYFLTCPRCGDSAYEVLRTYSYCIGCNYSPTLDEKYEPAIPEWALRAIEEVEPEEQSQETREAQTDERNEPQYLEAV